MIGVLRQLAATMIAVVAMSAFPLAGVPADRAMQAAGPRATQAPASAPTAPAAAPAPAQPAPARQIDVLGANAEETRQQFRQVLERHPPSLAQVFRLDPTLLTNADYLAPYPEVAAFLEQHPDIAHHPAFYVGTPDAPWDRDQPQVLAYRMWENMAQGMMIVLVLSLVTGVLVWIIKTMVDYRRWNRLTKVQTETHTKLLDRLTSQEDLLAYMQTPSGRRFLESAPIALDPASRPLGAPLARILWSVQAGTVLALGGAGLLYASGRTVPEIAEGVRTIGVLGVAVGAGFLASAVIAYLLAARLGLFERRPALEVAATAGLPADRE
jgi:hypothetical protein